MQVDPIIPRLKAPGIKRLKLQYDETLSIFAFKFNLRRHNEDDELDETEFAGFSAVGRCRLTLSNPF